VYQVHKQRECLCLQVRQRNHFPLLKGLAAWVFFSKGGSAKQHRRRRRASVTEREQTRTRLTLLVLEGSMAAWEAGALERPRRRHNLGVFSRPAAPASAALLASLKKYRDCALIGRKPREPFDLA